MSFIHACLAWFGTAPAEFWYFWLPLGFVSGHLFEVFFYTNKDDWPKRVNWLVYSSIRGQELRLIVNITLFFVVLCVPGISAFDTFLRVVAEETTSFVWKEYGLFGDCIGVLLYAIVMNPFLTYIRLQRKTEEDIKRLMEEK